MKNGIIGQPINPARLPCEPTIREPEPTIREPTIRRITP